MIPCTSCCLLPYVFGVLLWIGGQGCIICRKQYAQACQQFDLVCVEWTCSSIVFTPLTSISSYCLNPMWVRRSWERWITLIEPLARCPLPGLIPVNGANVLVGQPVFQVRARIGIVINVIFRLNIILASILPQTEFSLLLKAFLG